METDTTIRLDGNNYYKAKQILQNIGMDYAHAINLFNKMVVSQNGLPFNYKYPNQETLKAMEEAKNLEGEFVPCLNLDGQDNQDIQDEEERARWRGLYPVHPVHPGYPDSDNHGKF